MLDYFPPVTFGYPEQMIVSIIDCQKIHLPVMHFFAHSILEIEKGHKPLLILEILRTTHSILENLGGSETAHPSSSVENS